MIVALSAHARSALPTLSAMAGRGRRPWSTAAPYEYVYNIDIDIVDNGFLINTDIDNKCTCVS